MGDSATALRSFRPGYLAPYFRTRNVTIEARLYCFMAYRSTNMTFEACLMTHKRGLSNQGEMAGYRARRESLSPGSLSAVASTKNRLQVTSAGQSSILINN